MWDYQAPLAHMRFVIEDVLDVRASWARQPAQAELDAETAAEVLEQAARFCQGVLLPINASGDLEACRWQAGEVHTPAGFRAAYRAFVDAGWPALACDPADGGEGLPELLNAALYEMLAACNHGFTMYPGLLHGAVMALRAHGSEELRARWLPGLVSGQTLATMCLTEPQAGSDLGGVQTRAEAVGDGSWRIHGGKIFISGGEHDLSDNIVHLVLCRAAGAPPGSKGLSLMLCPKRLPDGSRNAVRCDGIEKKMGLKASATCVLSFDGASAWLVGALHGGLAAMFVMMNAARLHVAMQGLGHLEMATQNALRHAFERCQSRAAGAAAGAAPVAIAEHPAVRRALWSLRALVQGARVLAYWTAQLLDEAQGDADSEQRARAGGLVELLTPVLKAFLTHHGHHGAIQAQQIWGGYGYVHDYGIEQTVRDSRVAMVYEGTNEIQAIDLVQRKWLADGGRRVALLRHELLAEARRCEAAQPDFAAALLAQAAQIERADVALRVAADRSVQAPLHVADDVLHGLGHALLAWAWARTARVAAEPGADVPRQEWLAAARFGLQWLLPQAAVHWRRVTATGAELPMLAS